MISYVHQVEIDLQQWTGIKHWSEYQTDHADFTVYDKPRLCSWFAMKTGVGFRVAILALKLKYRGYSLIILIYIWNRLMK